MMMKILKKIQNLIRFGRVTKVGADDKQFVQSQYEYMGKTKEVIVIYPYGMSAKAPKDNLAVLMTVAHEENSIAFELSEDIREKNLKEGEVCIGNWITKSKIKFLQNGDVEITAKNNLTATVSGDATVSVSGSVSIAAGGNADITAPTINLNGNVIVTGNVTSSGTISSPLVKQGSITLGTHVHSGVMTGPSNTGPPV